MSTPKQFAINCFNCRSRLVLPPGYKFPIVLCNKCYSSTRIFNPALPFLGGAKVYYLIPYPSPNANKANPPKPPTPYPKAKKADPSKRPAPPPKAKKADPPKLPAPPPKAKKADPPKPPSLKAKKVDPSKPPSPKAKKADSRKTEDDNPGIQKRQIVVGGNQVNGNEGNQNRKFLDGNEKENFHFHVSKIILQRCSLDHQETEIPQRGWDRKETKILQCGCNDAETETETDAETETQGETETDTETETTDWETGTDGDLEIKYIV